MVMGDSKSSKHPGRDKKKAQLKHDAARQQAKRDAAKSGKLERGRPKRRQNDTMRFVGARQSTAARPQWRPTADSIVDVLYHGGSFRESSHTIVAITLLAALKLLAWVAPKLLLATGAVVIRRRQRALGVILSCQLSCSGLHKDPDDTFVLSIAGKRSVWVAAPAAVSDRIPRQNGRTLDGMIFLSDIYDPALPNAPPGSLSTTIVWQEFTLNAGDGLFIPRGWWHSVRSIEGSIGLAIEIQRGSIGATVEPQYPLCF